MTTSPDSIPVRAPRPGTGGYPPGYEYRLPGHRRPSWIAGPLPYHRQAFKGVTSSQWWRPLTTLGVFLLLGVVMMVALIALGAAAYAIWPDTFHFSDSGSDPRNLADVVALFGGLAALLPVAIIAVRWGGGRRGTLHSVTGRFRWGLMFRAARFVVPVYAVVIVGSVLLDLGALHVPPRSVSLVGVFVAIVVLTPLQSAAEEYVFRGLPQQGLGTWLKHPAWGIVLPVPLFMAGHGYDVTGQVDIAVFALCAGVLVWKSGGLELAVLMHATNNTLSLLFAPFDPHSLEQGHVSWTVVLVSVTVTLAVTAFLVRWVSVQEDVALREPVCG